MISQIFNPHTRAHSRTLSVSVSGVDVLVEELVAGSVSSRRLQVAADDQQGAQQREHGAETCLLFGGAPKTEISTKKQTKNHSLGSKLAIK